MKIINKTTNLEVKNFLKKSKISKVNDFILKYNNESIYDYYIIDLDNIFSKTICTICKFKNNSLYELYIKVNGDEITILYVFDYKTKKRYKSDKFLKKYSQIALIPHILKDYSILE